MKKFVIVVPRYLGMSPGKVASQVAHAASYLSRDISRRDWKEYTKNPVKYVLATQSMKETLELIMAIHRGENGICQHIFVDYAPTTQGTENHITAIGIFGEEKSVDKYTKDLELY